MIPSSTVFGVFLIAQLCIGIPENSLLFMLYAYTYLVKPHLKKHIDPIVMHLLLVNALTIMFTLIPDIASTLGVRQFLNDVGCQTVLFSYRVTQGVSICIPSVLSAFQALAVSPSNSKWAWLKVRLPTWMYPFFLFFWVINILLYFHIIKSLTATRNYALVGHGYIHAYCQSNQFSTKFSGSFLSIMLFHDLVFVLLMFCTSLYMVNLLYRHRRTAQHIHSPCVSSQSFPKHKGTQTFLLIVGCFALFYLSNNRFTFYSFYTPKKIPRLEGISLALSSCYPTICPYLLMKNHKIISKFTS